MNVLKLLRVNQYLKNLFVFFPIFFVGDLAETESLFNTFIAFFSFCAIASCVYILNDIQDVELDRLHPTKKKRPIASGAITKSFAYIVFIFAFFLAIAFAFLVNINVLILISAYFVLNLLYTYSLKNYAIVDICLVAFFFVIRVFVGGEAVGAEISKWLVLMVFLLALGLVLGKRYDDLLLLEGNDSVLQRKSLKGYNLEFVKIAIVCVLVISTVCYMMYTTSYELENRINSKYFYLTSIPVIIGVLKYLNIVLVEKNSGSPTSILLKNRFIQIVVIVWGLMNLYFYYFN